MAQAEGSYSVFTSRQSNRSQLPSMHLQPRNSGRSRHMSRVYSVSFHPPVTVYGSGEYHTTVLFSSVLPQFCGIRR